MAPVLWIDEDLDAFPAVERMITEVGGVVEPAYSIVDALKWLDDHSVDAVDCLLLDAMVRLGDPSLWAEEEDEYARYTGRIILDRFKKLTDKCLVLSIVPAKTLREAFPMLAKIDGGSAKKQDDKPAMERFFSKLDLVGENRKNFCEALRALLE